MLAGGLLLASASAALGEFRGFALGPVPAAAWLALLYLIVAGSILGFTCYVWLIHHQSPTRVATYAYVNPVVAVMIGYFFAGEAFGIRTVIGTLCVLVSVVVITTAPARLPATPVLRTPSDGKANG
jgi:drug/metabolite transporter (DMT)-like permease